VFGGLDRRSMSAEVALAEADPIYLDTSVLPKIDMEGGNAPESRFVRLLIYGSRVPIFCSLVSLGEFFKVAGSKLKQAQTGSAGYLYSCRALLMDLEIGKIKRVEPPADRFTFLQLADQIVARHGALGGGDIWHLMAARELKSEYQAVALLSFDTELVESAVGEGLSGVYGNQVDPEKLVIELTSRGRWVPA
jgi:hypothetical protein